MVRVPAPLRSCTGLAAGRRSRPAAADSSETTHCVGSKQWQQRQAQQGKGGGVGMQGPVSSSTSAGSCRVDAAVGACACCVSHMHYQVPHLGKLVAEEAQRTDHRSQQDAVNRGHARRQACGGPARAETHKAVL